jgi:orotidine-5'-phosphate decarboxylase
MQQFQDRNLAGDDPAEKIIIALDVANRNDALRLVDELSGHVGAFKIGLQLFCAAGPQIVRDVIAAGQRVFLDLKFHDIPNTAAMASVEAARLGAWMFNVHALGGREMMRRVADDVSAACERDGHERPLIMAVTVLTSSDDSMLAETGQAGPAAEQATRLALLAADCGLDGVVASAREAKRIKNAVGRLGFITVTPGIRQTIETNDDQKRVMSVRNALSAGADFLVVGRPVTASNDRLGALRSIVGE